MQLAYYVDPKGNFGDDLNPWLWNKLIPGLVDQTGPDILIGMGTVLENWFVSKLPSSRYKYVLGAGSGMQFPLVEIDETWKVYGVRGPLTARYLNLDESLALTDPATCLALFWPKRQAPRSKVGFMPHHTTAQRWNWQALCEKIGLIYVDPRGPALETLEVIDGLERLVTEAMHGAIVADALRVPWVPVRGNSGNYTGKWDDWGSTVRVPVQFQPLQEMFDPYCFYEKFPSLKYRAKALLNRAPLRSGWRQRDLCSKQLRDYAFKSTPVLSKDSALQEAVERFQGGAERLKKDLAIGYGEAFSFAKRNETALV